MQRTIHRHGVDFEVEFDRNVEVDALYIGGTEVTEVISDTTKSSIRATVSDNAARWFDEHDRELAGEMRRAA